MIQFANQNTSKGQKKGKDTADPKVVDQQLIIESVKNDYQNTADQIIIYQLQHLPLSFKNIWKIQNLQGLENLQKLQLDNNIIEKIQNLQHLVQLRWLDLSFNCIKEIEGLETLVNLEDISLFNNNIETIKGLDNCHKLNVFSIGNNNIKSYETIINYFGFKKNEEITKFKHLEVINVAGNPFTKEKESDFRNHIISNMPGLKYLDYIFIDETERNQIRDSDEKFKNEVTQQEYFRIIQAQQEKEKHNMEDKKKNEDARMNILDNMPQELTQFEELQQIMVIKRTAIEEEITKFKGKIDENVKNMQNQVKVRNQQKLQHMKKFEESLRNREIQSEKETIELLRVFEHEKKISFRKWEKMKADEQNENKDISFLRLLLDKTDSLKNNLMDVEMQLIEEADTSISSFESKLVETVTKDIEQPIDQGFKKIAEAIAEFHQKISDIIKAEQERFDKNSNNQENPGQELTDEEEDKLSLLESKDTLTSKISNIKDTLTEKSGNISTNVTSLIQKDSENYIKSQKEKQYERNRKNVKQIHEQIMTYQQDIKDKIEEHENESEGD